MEIKTIQTTFNVWPLFTKQTIYKTFIDPKTKKEYTEMIVTNLYNRKGQIEISDNYRNKIDIKI